MQRRNPKIRAFSLPELIVRVGAGSPVVSEDYHYYLSDMNTPSVETDFPKAADMGNRASISAPDVPLPASPALGEADVDVKLSVDADDTAGLIPSTDADKSSLSELEHLAPPTEGDELSFPSPLLPRVPAVTPAEFLTGLTMAPELDGQQPFSIQETDTETGKQQIPDTPDYFSMPTRVVITPGTPYRDEDDGKDLEPSPGLLGAPVQRSDSVSAGSGSLSIPTDPSIPVVIVQRSLPNAAPQVTDLRTSEGADQATEQISTSYLTQPLEISSNTVDMTTPPARDLNLNDGSSGPAPAVLVVAAADRVPLGQQGTSKLQTLPEEGVLGRGSMDVPNAASWAEEVLEMVASQQAILVGGPGHTITITSGKETLAVISSGEQPELSRVAANTTVPDFPNHPLSEDESPTPKRGRQILRKVWDAAQSLTGSHSRSTARKDEHPILVPDSKLSEVSEPAGTVYSNCPMKAEEVHGDPSSELEPAVQRGEEPFDYDVDNAMPSASGNVLAPMITSANESSPDAIAVGTQPELSVSAPAVLEFPTDPSSVSVPAPQMKWRPFTSIFRNGEPPAVEDDQAYLADSEKQPEVSASATSSFELSMFSSDDDESGRPGKGRLFVRKARNVALRRSVLVVMLGHQLAGPTKDALESLAKGEVWVGPQDA